MFDGYQTDYDGMIFGLCAVASVHTRGKWPWYLFSPEDQTIQRVNTVSYSRPVGLYNVKMHH